MSNPGKKINYGISPVAFGVRNPVPANLIMLAIILAGVVFGLTLRREMFPEIRPDRATIIAPYPGASPDDIESGLILKIEDKIADLDVVEELSSTIVEGVGSIVVEFKRNVDDIDNAVNDIKAAIDTLTDLPEEAERISTSKFEPTLPVISISLYGNADEAVMKDAIQEIRDDLKLLDGMGEVSTYGPRRDEIRVEIKPEALMRYGLSLPQVSGLIESWMKDVPGGTVRSATQTVRVRTMGVPEIADQIRQIVIKAGLDGGVVRLSDIATITLGFVDEELGSRINGEFGATAIVTNNGDEDTVSMAEMVRAYKAGLAGEPFHWTLLDRINNVINKVKQSNYRSSLARREKKIAAGKDYTPSPPVPPVLSKSARLEAYELGAARTDPLPGQLVLRQDLARFIEGRLDLLTRNAMWGALFVFLTLLLLLSFRVAMWVMLGLVVSLLGTLAFMAFMDITLNLLTMFGLIVVLGLLVDDAIVIAENIVARHEEGEPALAAAINGGRQIAWPVFATVLTTICAFIPLRFIEGQIGDFLGFLPIVVSCALSVSLLEALVILPSHMGHSLQKLENRKGKGWFLSRFWGRFEVGRDRIIHDKIIPTFGKFITITLNHRYIVVSIALGTWMISMGMIASNKVEFIFFPKGDSEIFVVDLQMPVGTSFERTDSMIRRIEESVNKQLEVASVEALVGLRLDTNDWAPSGPQSHIAQLYVELLPVEERTRTSAQVISSIREDVGELQGVKSLRYEEISGGVGGQAINLTITGDDDERMLEVAEKIKAHLKEYEGVFDISDDSDQGQREIQITLLEGASGLGLTNALVAQQIRGALYGLEPHTYSEDQEDIDVRVMLDEDTRRSLADIENLYIFTPSGQMVPLCEVARIREGTSYATIRRLNRKRAITVIADVDQEINNPERIIAEVIPYLAELQTEYPGIRIEPRGRQLETAKSMEGIKVGFFIACVLIYVTLSWLFSSYLQPIAVMLAIPFSMIGVIWGHYIMQYQMMILSLIGFVALTGIVVNDSLILIEFYNHMRIEGLSVKDSLIESSMRRLRPIVLTTMTTVLGLLPLMLERSFQAKFLIPMAISISFGLLSATLLTLIVLPCLILIGDDCKVINRLFWHGESNL